MFKNLKRVTYYTTDIEAGKNWYKEILNSEPLFSSPIIVIFKVNECELALLPAAEIIKSKNAAAFWEVDDVDSVCLLLKSKGASVLRDPRNVVNIRAAEMIDPFGNIIGLTGKIPTEKKSLEEQPSDSAMTVAFCRAMSAAEHREEIKGPDYLAHVFLNEESKHPLKDKAAREWVMKNILTGGAYEYFIARTAFIDKIFRKALDENIPQIVFPGAGYDTRAYRFSECLKYTKIFELDSPPTQARKIRLLRENDVFVPNNVVYIPLNFEKDNPPEKLLNNGYDPKKKTLFIWEGVTYYLSAEAFFGTLKWMKDYSAAGSILFFDYMLYSEERHSRPEIKEALSKMKATYKAESVNFMVNEGEIQQLLSQNGFRIIQEMHTPEMESTFLLLKDGSPSGRVIDLFSFILAEKG